MREDISKVLAKLGRRWVGFTDNEPVIFLEYAPAGIRARMVFAVAFVIKTTCPRLGKACNG
jgi:hypothetical protein